MVPSDGSKAHPTDPELAAAVTALERTWVGLGIEADGLVVRDGTIVPPVSNASRPASRAPDDEAGLSTPALPPLLGESPASAPPRHIDVGAPIGEGGMGVVSGARQIALERDVAVKALRADPANERRAARALLQEAYVLGGLEHPNVVPVYMLGVDDGGRPMIVMKRIHGVAWSEIIEEDRPPPESVDAKDPLAFHLSVLIQVCNAVSYAHSKGVLHRDIKPANVMIGDFGEVYLFDWGLAVSVLDAPPFGVKRARDVNTLAGTPNFMAPEMAACDGARIDERTDVYLLGACLHNLITRAPRHDGDTVVNVMASAFRSVPVDYGEEVPTELAAIANKATACDPTDRYQTALEMRQAIDAFLRHRHSDALTREAGSRVEALAERLAKGGEDDRHEVYNLFTEARFAFRQALREWPENRVAERGLQTALEQMAAYELAQGSWKIAEMFIAELPRPNERLSARLEAVRTRRQSERERMVQMERDVDARLGMDERRVMVMIISVVFGALFVVLGQLRRQEVYDAQYGTLCLCGAAYGAFVAAFNLAFREVLRQNAVNRRYLAILWIAFVGTAIWWPMGWVTGVPFPMGVAVILLLYGLCALAMGAAVELRLAWAGVPFLLGSIVAAASATRDLGLHFEAFAGGVFFSLQIWGLLWRKAVSEAPAEA